MMYDDLTLKELKALGHQFLDEYVALDETRGKYKAYSHAYEKLRERMSKKLGEEFLYGKHHFAKMKTKGEVMAFCGMLRDMIKRRKQKIAYKKLDVVLPQVELSKLKKV